MKNPTSWPLFWMGFNCPLWGDLKFIFYCYVLRKPWYSFDKPWKDERMTSPWRHPVILNLGALDCESSVLNSKPLLYENQQGEKPINFYLKKTILCTLSIIHDSIDFPNTLGKPLAFISFNFVKDKVKWDFIFSGTSFSLSVWLHE